MKTERAVIPLEGLSRGGGGVLEIELVLRKLPGIVRVHANAVTEMAYVEYDPSMVTHQQMTAAIERAGFRAGGISVR